MSATELPADGQVILPAPKPTSRWRYFWYAMAPVAGLLGTAVVAAALVALVVGRENQIALASVGQAIASVLFLGFIVWLSVAKREWLADEPISRSAWWRVKAVVGCWLLMTGFGMMLSVSGVIDPNVYRSYQDDFRALMAGSPQLLVWAVVVFIGPLAEELAFRRWMLSVLPKAIGAPLGVAGSALLFVLIHFPSFLGQFLMLLSLSAATTWLWLKTRDWRMCWALHALNNTLFLIGLYATQS